MTTTLDIVGLCGSLRAASINRAALRLAGASLPETARMEIVEWRDVPIFDADLLAKGMPANVAALAQRIARADGVVIATPEYNFSMPGGFKNLIDWLSRVEKQPFARKPLAILSASPGPLGGARVQYDLRRSMLFLDALVMAKPEVFIGGGMGKFDASGECTDEATRKFVGDQMRAFERWIAGAKRMNAE